MKKSKNILRKLPIRLRAVVAILLMIGAFMIPTIIAIADSWDGFSYRMKEEHKNWWDVISTAYRAMIEGNEQN